MTIEPVDEWDAPVDERVRNDAISAALFERLTASPDDMAIHHTLQVTSFGGSGTTALYEHLAASGADVPRTPGHFPFKHQPTPPTRADAPDGFRVIYLCGDPRDAVASVFRRGYQGGHYRGMRLANPPAAAEAHLANLRAFTSAGVDEFEIAAHFDRWLAVTDIPVLFVKYDALGSSWPTVREFAGLPRESPDFAITARATDWHRLPDPMRTELDRMYGDLAVRIAALSDTRLVAPVDG
jgi:hypothetical protein